MKWVVTVLFTLFCLLQYRLWFGDGSLPHKYKLQNDVTSQQKKNKNLKQKNFELAKELKHLTNSTDSIEERARRDLGMIRDGETFYMVVEEEN